MKRGLGIAHGTGDVFTGRAEMDTTKYGSRNDTPEKPKKGSKLPPGFAKRMGKGGMSKRKADALKRIKRS